MPGLRPFTLPPRRGFRGARALSLALPAGDRMFDHGLPLPTLVPGLALPCVAPLRGQDIGTVALFLVMVAVALIGVGSLIYCIGWVHEPTRTVWTHPTLTATQQNVQKLTVGCGPTTPSAAHECGITPARYTGKPDGSRKDSWQWKGGMTEPNWKRMNHRTWPAAVLALGFTVLVADAMAGESRVEQWTCGHPMCGVFAAQDDPDCNSLSLTADMDNDTGTVQFDDLPMQNARFWVDGFDRVWMWPSDDPAYGFVIDHNHNGFYFRSLAKDSTSDARFTCRR